MSHTVIKYIESYEAEENWAHTECKFRARVFGSDGDGENRIDWDYYHYYEIKPQPWEFEQYNMEKRTEKNSNL